MDLSKFSNQFEALILNNIPQISNIRPSDWVEQNIKMGEPFPGPYRYSRTPYCRDIIDCLSPDHPARTVAVMKGAQIGISAGVLIPGMCWIIKENPGNTYFTVGAPDLINKSVEKLDLAIDNAGLRSYIKSQVSRKKAQKSGDTNTKKDFTGGFINITTPNNHKEWRDVSLKYGLVDDFESAKSASKESGDTRKLIEQRFAAYADTRKIFYISTPELADNSNIEAAYLLGDQRKWLVPCLRCGEVIEWQWVVNNEAGEVIGGMTWKTNALNKIDPKSVGYICQSCGGFSQDKKKHEQLNNGIWMPTASPSSDTFFSFHISSLYAPLGMYDWAHYVQDWIDIHPVGQPRNEGAYKTFRNVVLAFTYKETTTELKSAAIQRNSRPYEIGLIPEELSIKDGNGRIVMLTIGSDMNGKEDDARLDWELLAHSESGAVYSISHGSIGTFIPRENSLSYKVDRVKKSYVENDQNSVWVEFTEIIEAFYKTDTGREMGVMITTLDSGHFTTKAYWFVDYCKNLGLNVVAVKGNKEDVMVKYAVDVPLVKMGVERPNLYILQVGLYKDKLAEYMNLIWDQNNMQQPPNFMNFPISSGGLYQFQNYYEHFEAEVKRVVENRDGSRSFRWEKKTSVAQNHMFDCRIYNIAARDIMLFMLSREFKKKITFTEFVQLLTES